MQTLAEQGGSSKEKEFQKEREKNVLAVLVFDQNMMDDSPKEPELEVSTICLVIRREAFSRSIISVLTSIGLYI